jgi:hypothetical protein
MPIAPPAWLVAFLRLGQAVARSSGSDQVRTVIAMSVPVRSFCAVAVGWGFSMATAGEAAGRMSVAEIERAASELPRGNLVRLVHRNRVQLLRYYGRTGRGLHLGGSTFPLDRIVRIEGVPDSLGLREGPPHEVPTPTAGLASLLPGVDLEALSTEAAARVALIGPRPALAEDLALRVGMASGATSELPEIRDVLRPFAGFAPIGWRSVVSSATSADLLTQTPGVDLAVLDGGLAVSYWLRDIPARTVVVVLDRGSAASETAALAVQQEWSRAKQRRLTDLNWRPPAGCEALVFSEEGWHALR